MDQERVGLQAVQPARVAPGASRMEASEYGVESAQDVQFDRGLIPGKAVT
jgi:hypothetical protein